MSLGIAITQEPGRPRAQIGKFVTLGTRQVFCFDGPTEYRKLKAYGVALCVLVQMLKHNYTEIHYISHGCTWATTVNDVLRYGIEDTHGDRKGYLYMPAGRWTVSVGRLLYGWIPASARVELPWLTSSPLITQLRGQVHEAARPAGIQLAMLGA